MRQHNHRRAGASRFQGVMLGLLAAVIGGANAADIAQAPLYAGSTVPGNIALVPSVEFPTVISVANLGNYSAASTYVGYFDSNKCYQYNYSATEAERHFAPVSLATGQRVCTGANRWSGNYLNWAATQTIDPFRSALTGGYRVRDTPTETWLEKARADRVSTTNFPRRRTPVSGDNMTLVSNATGATGWTSMTTRVDGLGNKMYITRDGNLADPGVRLLDYDPTAHPLDNTNFPVGHPLVGQNRGAAIYELSMRVKVCDPAAAVGGVEANCRQYSQGWKPEGLIQEYSNRVRYSIFGYLNDSSDQRDGGVLRANQKYVGPFTHDPLQGSLPNAAAEWDQTTGVQFRNPNPADATATTSALGIGADYPIQDSGVINYLNKFGQVATNRNLKSIDPVSELYYTATRYFKGLGNVPQYSSVTDGSSQGKYNTADAFPVITSWNDPIQYRCQANAIIGIGDVNTHVDKNLPGATSTYREPGKPGAITADTTIDVVRAMNKIAELEGDSSIANLDQFSGRANSAYIAALAYDLHTTDVRPEGRPGPLLGRQSVSTYWVDVLEYQQLANRTRNQYWLAAKYGGFRMPAAFDPYTRTDPLPLEWWSNTGDTLTSNYHGVATFPRPDNYYPAADASRMVASLRQAFENFIDSLLGSGGSLAASSTSLQSGTKVFQGRFLVNDGSWHGDMQSFDIDPDTGTLSPDWTASSMLPSWASRNIWVNSGGFRRLDDFSRLSAAHRTALGSEAVMNYLRGDRANEQPGGNLRARSGLLGDIVNSQPVYVGAPNRNLYLNAAFTGSDEYQQFAADNVDRQAAVYVGANDGMLHSFDAETGAELFAFMPATAIEAGLRDYSNPNYEHRYFVDGELTVADVYDSSGSGRWRTILVGTMGRGGRGMFALDVTNPIAVEFLWEKNAADIPALGNNLGKPVIAQVADGTWNVFLGNGPNSTGGNAQLVVVDLLDGTVRASRNTNVGGDNGLSGVNVWATTTPGGFFNLAYAGDLRGNVWKFDLTNTDAPVRLFSAAVGGNEQPITATPLVARKPNTTETWIFFGTGRYLNIADLSDERRQSWYGIVDRGTAVSRGSLREIDILVEGVIDGVPVRGIDESSEIDGDGWYMDLVSPVNGEEGERMVVPNQFRGTALIGTTRIPNPDDACSPTGRGFVMAINPFTGGRLAGGFFDVDGDGEFTETIGDPPIPVSGVGLPSGSSNPTFIGDIMFNNLDDATTSNFETNPPGTQPRRVSWRELLRN